MELTIRIIGVLITFFGCWLMFGYRATKSSSPSVEHPQSGYLVDPVQQAVEVETQLSFNLKKLSDVTEQTRKTKIVIDVNNDIISDLEILNKQIFEAKKIGDEEQLEILSIIKDSIVMRYEHNIKFYNSFKKEKFE